jgi:hypothetical protein
MEAHLPTAIRQQYHRLTDRLVEEFRDRMPVEAIHARADEHLHEFHGARILDFVPILTYRYTREDLRTDLRQDRQVQAA